MWVFPPRNWVKFNVWCVSIRNCYRRLGMHSLVSETDLRVMSVSIDDDRLTVELMDGRAISVPLAWYPRLANASQAERERWELAGAGYGIHWPDIDEDLSTEGLLRGARAPRESTTLSQSGCS